ncbi:Putative oxidoreductase [hydrothermal vent metagenome]|uniref:Oxidoreductase n=1 Tax=hydrothermal vent metagenome TaxID=652676 RepID=A0A3B0VKT0_9ZZZZ
MKLTSWGNYPKAEARSFSATCYDEIKTILQDNSTLITQGNSRSYGDSAFARTVIDMKTIDCFLSFDSLTGIISCQSGVLLVDILETIIPQGWILPVLPGTQLITVGGAIASDVHGKNHHQIGAFSQFVKSIKIMDGRGNISICSNNKNKKLFHASCGGMGLTGVILEATIQLLPVKSNKITQTVIKADNLQQLFAAFEDNTSSPYSVAWVDCLAKGRALGKGLLMLGKHENKHNKTSSLDYKYTSRFKMAFNLPAFVLSSFTVRLFNWFYYYTASENSKTVTLQKFFFPLDSIVDWNKMYGKKGFVQYQFVLPLEHSLEGMTAILTRIAESKQGSFLTVLKRMGKANDRLLSFPMEGYSLALDFRINPKVLALLDELDAIVVKYQGRIYLCKDARMSLKTFNQGYPQAEKFRKLRKNLKLDQKFQSQQAQRLNL